MSAQRPVRGLPRAVILRRDIAATRMIVNPREYIAGRGPGVAMVSIRSGLETIDEPVDTGVTHQFVELPALSCLQSPREDFAKPSRLHGLTKLGACVIAVFIAIAKLVSEDEVTVGHDAFCGLG